MNKELSDKISLRGKEAANFVAGLRALSATPLPKEMIVELRRMCDMRKCIFELNQGPAMTLAMIKSLTSSYQSVISEDMIRRILK